MILKRMTWRALLLFLSLSSFTVIGQVAINTIGAGPSATAMLDISSTTKGVLFPRMTTAQRQAISSPATGLLVYDTDLNELYYYTTSQWVKIKKSNWLITGNSGTTPGTHFLGTTDYQDLALKTNGTEYVRVNGANDSYIGYVGIGTNDPKAMLHVSGGSFYIHDGSSSNPSYGAGTRFLYNGSGFRAGYVSDTRWDGGNDGVAFGYNADASSSGMNGDQTVAMGYNASAAFDAINFAFGKDVSSTCVSNGCIAIGNNITNTGVYSMLIGAGPSSSSRLTNTLTYAFVSGFGSTTPAFVLIDMSGGVESATNRIGIGGVTSPQKEIHMKGSMRLNGSTSGYAEFASPSQITTSYTFTLPSAQGTAGQALKNTTSGALGWGTTPASSTNGWTDAGASVYVTNTAHLVGMGQIPMWGGAYKVESYGTDTSTSIALIESSNSSGGRLYLKGSLNSYELYVEGSDFRIKDNSFGSGVVFTAKSTGYVGLGLNNTSPTHAIHLKTADAAVGLNEMTSALGSVTSGTQAILYMRSDKLIIAYRQDASNIKYRYLTLNGTDATWTYQLNGTAP